QEQVGGEGVPQSVSARMLGDACLVLGLVERPLKISFVQMVPATLSRPRIPKQRRSRKGVLPSPLSVRARIFSRQGVGKTHPAIPRPKILFVKSLDSLQVLLQLCFQRSRQHRHPIFLSLTVPHGDLVVGKVDVLHPQAQALRQPHPGAIKQGEKETLYPGKMREDRLDLLRRQHHGELPSPPRPDKALQFSHLLLKDYPVQKQQSAQGLHLGRSTDLPLHRQVGEESVDLLLSHLPGVTLPMKEDVAPNPVKVRLFCLQDHMAYPQGLPHPLQETGLPRGFDRDLHVRDRDLFHDRPPPGLRLAWHERSRPDKPVVTNTRYRGPSGRIFLDRPGTQGDALGLRITTLWAVLTSTPVRFALSAPMRRCRRAPARADAWHSGKAGDDGHSRDDARLLAPGGLAGEAPRNRGGSELNGSVPARSRSVPIMDDSVTFRSHSAPLRNDSVPVPSRSVPLLNGSVPGRSRSVPILDDSVTVRSHSVSLRSRSVPLLNGSVPVRNRSVPVLDDSAPVPSRSIPLLNGSVPVRSRSVPVPDDSVPVRSHSVSLRSRSAPLRNDSAPVPSRSVPLLNGSVPMRSRSAPVLDDSVPVRSHSVPLRSRSAPLLNGSVPVPTRPFRQRGGRSFAGDAPRGSSRYPLGVSTLAGGDLQI